MKLILHIFVCPCTILSYKFTQMSENVLLIVWCIKIGLSGGKDEGMQILSV